MSAKRRIEPYHVAAAVLALLAVLSVVKTLFSGLEIDEQYALSISWRLVKGDALFYTMWEPHQLSALPCTPAPPPGRRAARRWWCWRARRP